MLPALVYYILVVLRCENGVNIGL